MKSVTKRWHKWRRYPYSRSSCFELRSVLLTKSLRFRKFIPYLPTSTRAQVKVNNESYNVLFFDYRNNLFVDMLISRLGTTPHALILVTSIPLMHLCASDPQIMQKGLYLSKMCCTQLHGWSNSPFLRKYFPLYVQMYTL